MVTLPDAGSPERSQPDHGFDFCGGQLAVDFTNTVGSRGGAPAERKEHFNTFGDIVAWAEGRGVVSRRQAAGLRKTAARNPEAARRQVRRARELRETLYSLLAATAGRRAPHAADLARFNGLVGEIYAGASLSTSRGRFVLDTPEGEGLDVVLRAVGRAAVDLLTSGDVTRLGICAEHSCAWLFLDATRSRSRRWCDMKACGNRNKVRRFRQSK